MVWPMHDEHADDPLLSSALKGFPLSAPPLRLSALPAQRWNVLAGDLPLPLAVIRRAALEHNIGWMQDYVRSQGIALAPHGKTTMSPQLFRRQLDAGAWGLTFATVKQLAVGVQQAGVRRALIANQVCSAADLSGLALLQRRHADLRVLFLVDSLAQCALIERWQQAQGSEAPVFEVLLEIGLDGGRTGTRTRDEALALAAYLHAAAGFRPVGIECYEGLGAQGDSAADQAYADALMARVRAVAEACAERGWFDSGEVIVSAGGSGIFDLVAGALRPRLAGAKPVLGLLRSGCYITHDHGHYKRLVSVLDQRCQHAGGLQSALEVWALVQSCPEPGLAILAVGRRDLSFDIDLPIPVWHALLDSRVPQAAPAGWRITGLNDQHAYLRWDPAVVAGPQVGDRLGLGISHPCTTFDKWTWLPIVEDDYRISDAVLTHF
jgi:D-serine dehydratase